jgi:hypothetical protein
MSLLDTIMTANGDSSANYAMPGRHVVRLNRLTLRDPTAPGAIQGLPAGFKFDGEVLAVSYSEPGKEVGSVLTFTDPFKQQQSALARIRRLLAAAKTAKTGKVCLEANLGLEQAPGEADGVFGERIKDEVKRLLGPTSPLSGAIVTVVVTGGKNQKTGGAYSLFEVFPPTEADLKAAKIIE